MKLLAIIPLSKEYCKNLKQGEVYKFNSNYQIDRGVDDELKVVKISEDDFSLYSVRRRGNRDGEKINVNVSALVGRNGSGKSSLLEMLYIFCFIVSYKKRLLNFSELKTRKNIPDKVKNLIDNFKIEIIYELNNIIYRVTYYGNSVRSKKLEGRTWKVASFKFQEFFYTIGVNYSLYGNNSSIDYWLKYLFHKNDGYQSPIVLNPFRNDGLIDINLEHHLAQSRLLSNITSYSELHPVIIDEKKIDKIEFLLIPDEYENLGIFKMSDVVNKFEKYHLAKISDLIENLISEISGIRISEDKIDNFQKLLTIERTRERSVYEVTNLTDKVDPTLIEYEFLKYIIRKVYKICAIYKDYSIFLATPEENENFTPKEKLWNEIPLIGNVKELTMKLKEDRSHITLKLRQAIYTLMSGFLLEIDFHISIDSKRNKYFYRSEIGFKEYSNYVNNLSLKFDASKIELIPGSVVKARIHLLNESQFSTLSSGELQFLHSIHSIIYHLTNLNSVYFDESNRPSKRSRVTYSNVNLVLDEIELYFHPEFQRKFVSSILKELEKIDLGNLKNINFIFSTHSPFILSDILNSKILCLENGSSVHVGLDQKTFGANIHNLLSNQFFLNNGFLGEFSKLKINEAIQFLNAKISVDKLKDVNSKIESEKFNHLLIKEREVLVKSIIFLASKLGYNNLENPELDISEFSIKIGQINSSYYKFIIENVGEPVLKAKLLEIYNLAFPDLHFEIVEKEAQLRQLANELNFDVIRKK
jgi:hypothetical protein